VGKARENEGGHAVVLTEFGLVLYIQMCKVIGVESGKASGHQNCSCPSEKVPFYT